MLRIKRNVVFFICLALSIACIAFIFSNSLDTGAESTAKSSLVTNFLNDSLDTIGLDTTVSHSTVRTLAHFVEFAALAVLICPLLFFAPIHISPLFTPVICLAIAILDELLQTFSDGRAVQLIDVAVDVLGAIAGTVAFAAAYYVIILIRKASAKKASRAPQDQ